MRIFLGAVRAASTIFGARLGAATRNFVNVCHSFIAFASVTVYHFDAPSAKRTDCLPVITQFVCFSVRACLFVCRSINQSINRLVCWLVCLPSVSQSALAKPTGYPLTYVFICRKLPSQFFWVRTPLRSEIFSLSLCGSISFLGLTLGRYYMRYLLEHFNLSHFKKPIYMLNSTQRPNPTGYPLTYVSLCLSFQFDSIQ